ncbi:MAG: hypothetical protein IJS17_04580 [Clostridia bacterium]|nr:hypothetical protein [Clostridia bacterium]
MKLRKIISAVLCLCLMMSLAPLAHAKQAKSARLYNVYGDNMLFKQKDNAVLSGKAAAGSTVKAVLFDENGNFVTSGSTLTSTDGVFEVSFTAPAGSFTEYSIVLSENGEAFQTLKGVVFGELWLASGQSNMEYGLGAEETIEAVRANGYGSEWVRALLLVKVPAEEYTLEKQEENIGAKWVKSSDPVIEEVSAVAYFFAQKLVEKIGMPVGILNANRGGSVLASWLSRERVDSDPQAFEILKRSMYFTPEQAVEMYEKGQLSATRTFSSYNELIYPIRHFTVSGALWYQGESDVGEAEKRGDYTYLFNMLQEEFSETFNFDGDIPMIIANLANYGPSYTSFNLFNEELASLQTLKPESRAVVTHYDVIPYYTGENNAIHPRAKKTIGERMFAVASSLVYGEDGVTSAAYVKETKIENGAVFVTLSNTGDGLVSADDSFFGFAVCGEDGIYYKAQAEIVSKDTLKISNEEVNDPVSASYAISSTNMRSKLYSTQNGEPLMPVSPFVTDITKTKLYYLDTPSADMEQSEVWLARLSDAHFAPIWETSNCSYTVDSGSAFAGDKGMNLVSNEKSFFIARNYTLVNKWFYDNVNYNWSNYKSLRVRVRNSGDKNVTISFLKLITETDGKWFAPTVNGLPLCQTVIPADSQWHTVEYDLTNLYVYGIPLLKYDSSEISKILRVQLDFSNPSGETDLDIDEFEFSSTVQSGQSKRPVSFAIKAYRFFNKLFNDIGNLFKSISC